MVSKRIFIGIPIGVKATRQLSDACKSLHPLFDQVPITWVSPKNYHLTLLYFGMTQEKDLQEVDKILRRLVPRFSSLELFVTNFNVFPEWNRARVIYGALALNEPLLALQREICSAFPEFEEDRFVPHITVARLKAARPVPQDVLSSESMAIRDNVNEVILYESLKEDQGPEYLPLVKYRLS